MFFANVEANSDDDPAKKDVLVSRSEIISFMSMFYIEKSICYLKFAKLPDI